MSDGKKTLGYEQEYSGSAGNVIKNVLLAKADAGAVFVTEVEKETSEVRDRIRSIYMTPPIAPHPLVVHPRVGRGVQDSVKKAVFELASDTDGAQLLKSLRLSSPVPADYVRDYQSLETMDIKGLSNWGE